MNPKPNIKAAIMIAVSLSLSCDFTIAQPTTASASFDGEKAYDFLLDQVGYGPRLPNSEATSKTRALILKTLSSTGFSTGTQDFRAVSPIYGQELGGQNLYGIYPAGSKVKYLISAHYDCRPKADNDPNPGRRGLPVPGANDGASGVAILLELARVVPSLKLPHGVAVAFFDLEDHGISAETFCLGSRFMARNLPKPLEFELGINLDMVGDADLKVKMEGYSYQKSRRLTMGLWQKGNALYPDVFLLEQGPSIYDDHMPFIGRGKQFTDVIDFEYSHWHTTNDTADKCSPKSLEIIGHTVLEFIKD
jgi:glutaminyl-peptide cyclotransferase